MWHIYAGPIVGKLTKRGEIKEHWKRRQMFKIYIIERSMDSRGAYLAGTIGWFLFLDFSVAFRGCSAKCECSAGKTANQKTVRQFIYGGNKNVFLKLCAPRRLSRVDDLYHS